MAKNNAKKLGAGWYGLLVAFGLFDLGLVLKKFMHGHNIALFNPQGYIAKQEHSLLLFTSVVLLSVAVPTILLLFFMAWKYRESNTSAVHEPNKKHGNKLDALVWGFPTLVMLVLAFVMWPATHKLEPQKAIAAQTKPITIQVISMRWKWLFIYPEQQIATVNYLQIPVDTPVQFELTADDAPMSSFWIPNLGGQLYSMTGMVNKLNLMADAPGDYVGSSAELNGAGFADMKFTAHASYVEDFDTWVKQVKQTEAPLDAGIYADLVKPSEKNSVAYYSSYQSGLYDKVLMKYMGPSGGHGH